MDIKEKGSDSIQQYTEDGRGLLVREHYSEELRNFLVAVYGTLKRGYGNHALLHGADFIAEAYTEDKYPLVVHGSGLPFLVDKPGVGKNVKVEVYLVDKDTLEALDMLEGHPDWYERKQKNVLCTGLSGDGFDYHNAILSPWIYMAPENYYTEAEVLYETY
jgi:gamma-glutamylcyclotransferase (GGCT)/AIG2-like uncharacterized protein YtfP